MNTMMTEKKKLPGPVVGAMKDLSEAELGAVSGGAVEVKFEVKVTIKPN